MVTESHTLCVTLGEGKMKKTLRLFALLLVIVFALVSCNQDPVVKVQQTPTIRGSVSIPEGTGLTGRDFYIRIMEGEKAVFTGRVSSDGTFSVPGLEENVSYNVLLTTEEPGDVRGSEKDLAKGTTSGYGGWLSNVSASINEQAGVGSVKVKPLGTIMGIVKKDGAEDHYDTTVYIPGTSYLAMTDGEGNFSIFNVPQSTYTLRYTANGYMAKMVDNVVLYSDSDTENPVTTVQLQTLIKNAGNLVGTISKIGSNDHSNITVMLSDGENTFTGSTAEDGSLLISNIIPGTYTATISSSGFVTQTFEDIKIEAAKNTTMQPVNLTANGGSIIGTISLNNNSDRAGAIITARGVDNGYSYTAGTDTDGRFTISGAFPGTYTVTISKTGFSTVTVENIISVAGQTTELGTTKLVSLYGSVSGKVSLSDSVDSSGVIIELRSVDNASIAPKTLSGTDGTYSFENLSVSGQYILTFSKDGFVSDSGKTVTVSPGINSQIEDVELRSLASKVSGTVTLAETEDYSGVIVLLKAKDNSIQYDATTDQQGEYLFARVKPGEYSLTVSKTGYKTKDLRSVIVGSSTEKKLDRMSLEIGTRSIIGSVKLEERAENDYSGVLVAATNLSNPKLVYSAISNSAGLFTLAEMKPGEYSITLSHSKYNTITLPTVNIIDDSVIELEEQYLPIARGTIYGSVKLEGRTDYSGVTVQVIGKTGDDYTTTTDAKGDYSLYIPQGNYPGVRASMEDFQFENSADVISLFAENEVPIETLTLKATHVSVFGYVDVKDTDVESDVSIVIEDEPSFGKKTTSSDGYFRFDHLPVGETFTLRFSRDMCADVTIEVTTKPSAGIDLKTVNMLADSSAIEGIVSLDGMTNNAGVTVYVETADGRLSTTTDTSGYYYIGGLSTMGSYTVHAEKTGWDSKQTTVSGLVALEVSTVETLTLFDTTSPRITSLKLNGGANATGSRSVNIRIDVEEQGSGPRYMRYKWNDAPMSSWVDYSATFKSEIPDSINGQYTFTVELQDGAGNITVQSGSSSISLVGQIKTVRGRLSGEDLHWRAEQNPIVVTDIITVGQGDELIIDPGVDILFDDDFSIIVADGGKLTAKGTAEKPIVLRSSRDYMSEYEVDGYNGYEGNWSGIQIKGDNNLSIARDGYSFELLSGSILSYCIVSDIYDGITGNLLIDNSTIYSVDYAVGNRNSRFRGSIINSSIHGSVNCGEDYQSYIYGNTFEGVPVVIDPTVYKYYSDYGYYYWWDSAGQYREAYEKSIFQYYNWNSNPVFVNNCISNYTRVNYEGQYIPFSNNTISDTDYLNFRSNNATQNVISNIGHSIDLYGSITFSNIIGDFADYIFKIGSENFSYDLTNNYWGKYTAELDAMTYDASPNASFIYDGYDYSGYSIADLRNHAAKEWEFAGYMGDSFLEFSVPDHVTEVKIGDAITIPLVSTTANQIDSYKIAQRAEDLDSKEWTAFNGSNIIVTETDIDRSLLVDGVYLYFFIQAKSGEKETSVKVVRIPSDIPTITDVSMFPTKITDDSRIKVSYRIFDYQEYGNNSSGQYLKVYLDEELISWWDSYFHSGLHEVEFYPSDYSGLKNGDHVLKLVIADRAGNENSSEIPISITRPVPSTEGLVFEGDTTIPANGSLDINLSISNAKHLRYVRFYSDDVKVFEQYYDNNGDNTREISKNLDAHYLKAGTHTLFVEFEDYSGNISRTEDYEYTVEGDSSGPIFSEVTYNDGDTVGSDFWSYVTITATKGVKRFAAYLGDDCIWDGWWGDTYSSDKERMVISFSRNLREIADGEIVFTLKATDYAGNETTETRTLNLQKTWPTVKASVFNKKTSFAINVEVSSINDINSIKVYANGDLIGKYEVSGQYDYWSQELTKSKSLYPEGEYEITVELENRVGETRIYQADKKVVVDNVTEFTENNLVGVTTIEGVLNDTERLHWTAEMSPIVITGPVTVPQERTLVIDPGVEVLFEGNYSITVRGTIEARGTKNNPIVFRSSAGYVENHEGYYGSWKGISLAGDLDMYVDGYKYEFYYGSVFEYCEIYDLSTGIVGRPFVYNCIIDAQGYALGYNDGDNWFRGAIVNSTVYGSVKINDARIVFGSEFNGSSVVNSYFCYDTWNSGYKFINNLVTGYSGTVDMRPYYGVYEYNTISDITGYLNFCRYDEQNGTKYNEITRISRTINLWSDFRGLQYSNITELNGSPQINVDSSLSNRSSFDMTYNYWGELNTVELQRAKASSGQNAAFIYDGYDDSNKTVIDWEGFVETPWQNAGYKGDNFIDFSVPDRVTEVKIGDDITISVTTATTNEINEIRVAQSIDELTNAEWQAFNGLDVTINGSGIDRDLISDDGYLTFYIQAKCGDYETAIKSVKVPSDCPRITVFSLSKTNITDDSECKLTYRIFDSQNYDNHSDGQYARVFIDDIRVCDCDRYFCDWNHECTFWLSNYQNGDHVMKLVVSDLAGNESSKEVVFTIDRPTPTVETLTFDDGTTIAGSGSLKMSIDMKDAAYLRYVRFFSDDTMIRENYYYENGEQIRTESFQINAHYLKNGEHTIYVELEDKFGNKSETDKVNYIVEGINVGPVFSSISLNDGDIIESDLWCNVVINASKGVKRFSAYLNDECLWDPYWGDEYSSDKDRMELSVSRNMRSLADGEVVLTLKATDYAGNETTETRTLNLQKTWPTVKASVFNKKTSFAINVEVSSVSEINAIKVFANGELIGRFDVSGQYDYWSQELTKSKSLYPEGEYEITVGLENRVGEPKTYTADKKVVVDSVSEFTENNLEGVTTIAGILNDSERLHWTAGMSPVVITGHVTVPQERTLVIDPGVEVLFEGNYSITVRGTVKARGTEDDPIVFRSSAGYVENHEGYYGTWKGIVLQSDLDVNVDGYRCTYNSGNIFEYCEISDLSDGISGSAFISDSTINSSGYALGSSNDNKFRGVLIGCDIYGNVRIENSRFIFNNKFDGSSVVNSYFYFYMWGWEYNFINNLVSSYNDANVEATYGVFEFNTLQDLGSLRIRRYYENVMKYNEINGVRNQIYLYGDLLGMQFSNITGLEGLPYALRVDSRWGDYNNRTTIDMTNNYWGEAFTAELQKAKASSGQNASFIFDGSDDDSLMLVDWYDFVTTPWENAGYKGDYFIDFSVPDRVTEVKIGDDITISVTTATTNEINEIRVAQSIDELTNAEWQAFNGSNVTINGTGIDRDLISDDGYLTFYIQAKCGDYETAIKSVKVPSDCPRIMEFSLSSSSVSDTSPVKLKYRIMDSQNYGDWTSGQYAKIYVDDVEAFGVDSSFWNETRQYNFYPSNYLNGDHVLKFVVVDNAGNESSKEISFSVALPTPTVEALTFEGGTTVLANGSLKVNLEISNAMNLRCIRFYSDEDKVFEQYYYDNSDESRMESIELDAHYLKAGTHNLFVELEDHFGNKTESEQYEFTVEGVNAGPVFSSISLNNGDTIADSFGFSMTVASEKGVKSVSMCLGDSEIWSNSWDSYSSDRDRLEYSWLGSWDITNRPDGEVELKLKAVDFAGNKTEEIRTLVIQKSWPTVKTTVYNKKISFSIKPEISDVSRINMIRVLIDGELLLAYDCSNSGGNWSNEILKSKTGYSVGEHEVKIELENNIGEKKTFAADKNIVVDDMTGGFIENNLEGVTTIEGMLNDDARLHWTIEMSPVVITGNITVAAGKTLVIDSGVEVLFEGNYSITVRGNIDARGTESNPIVFRSSAGYVQNHEGYYGTWKGITSTDSLNVTVNGYDCIFNSGSIFEHCDISDMSDGIIGKAYISDSTISSSGYALGNSNGSVFGGVLLNSEANGSVRLEYNQLVFNTVFDGSSSADPYFRIYNHSNGYKFVNNLVTNYNDVDLSIYECVFEFNTIRNISGVIRVRRYDNERGTRYNEIDNVSDTIYLYDPCNGLQYSNITNLKGSRQIYVEANWNANSSFDMSNNYWGDANTVELQRAKNSAGKNASFIYDGYDDNNKAMVVWDNFVSSEWEFAGYKGDGFIDFDASLVQAVSSVNEIKIGNDIPFKLTLKSGGTISKYRIAQSMEDLFNEDWQNYSGGCYLYASEIDESKIEDGKIKVFLQIKTLAGVESAPVICTVSHDVPTITFNAIREGDIITSSSLIPIQAEFYDSSNNTHFMTYIDGNIKCEGGYGYLGNGFYNIWGGYPWTTDPANMSENDYLDPAAYGNGEHILTIFAEDRVGNTTTKVIHFTIQIAPPSLKSVELSNDGVVGEGESLTVSVRIDNAENLKTVKILSDGDEIISKTIDTRVPTFSDVFSISSDYLRSGEHNLKVVMVDRFGGTITSDNYPYTATGDDTAPTIGGFDVTEGQEFTENEVKAWTLTVSDDTGVKNLFFDIDGVRIYQYIARDVESSYQSYDPTIRFRVYGYQNGEHTLTVTASDFAGNETEITRMVTVNKALPTAYLNKVEESNDYVRYSASVSKRGWMYDGYIIMDGEILKYFMINSTSNEDYSWDTWTDYLYYSNLPSGTHTLKAVFNSQGGDRIESDELTFTNDRVKNDSKYGLNKTWNADGTLIVDRGTKYLWNFDDSMGLNYESVSDKNLGTVKATRDGLGSKAGSLYFNNDDVISFFNSEWTVEYWAKDEYSGTDSTTVELRNVMRSYNYHNSSNTDSYIGFGGYYTMNDESFTEEWMNGAWSSRKDRSEWHHYAFVSTGDRFEIYMDGILTSSSNGYKASNRTANGMYIDMTDTAYIDELRISDVARSADELWDYVQYVKSNNLLPD